MPAVPPEEQLLSVAERAARAAGAELMQRFGREPVGVHTKSTPTDPVSAADLAAEEAVREVLTAERPGDVVLGEEGGQPSQGDAEAGGGGFRWVVDPLDGTVNFLYGIPHFAVSVACEDRSGAVAGVVFDPVRNECFKATRGGPALLDDEPLRGGRPDTLGQTLVATGFGYEPEVRGVQGDVAAALLPRVRDIRRAGAAALDLAWCACGRVDAYFERGLHLWDFAAGALLCARAGLVVRRLAAPDPGADGFSVPDGLVVAAPSVIDELEGLIA
ncbi:MAG TPA: inositol monophosphatase family protein [Solirubrobacteraceae bacterium]|jgi:myo-inositol-1(or 4)-monophosphatase|nr:inositol monophosphatase family protein [Solirubrobacteraceae bacterium]